MQSASTSCPMVESSCPPWFPIRVLTGITPVMAEVNLTFIIFYKNWFKTERNRWNSNPATCSLKVKTCLKKSIPLIFAGSFSRLHLTASSFHRSSRQGGIGFGGAPLIRWSSLTPSNCYVGGPHRSIFEDHKPQ